MDVRAELIKDYQWAVDLSGLHLTDKPDGEMQRVELPPAVEEALAEAAAANGERCCAPAEALEEAAPAEAQAA